MNDQPRPVWLTEDQIIRLIHAGTGFGETIWEIKRQWDAAPGDPARAVDRVLTSLSGDLHLERLDARDAVLRALGMPS